MAGISKVWRNIARRRTNEREGSVKRVISSRYIQEVERDQIQEEEMHVS